MVNRFSKGIYLHNGVWGCWGSPTFGTAIEIYKDIINTPLLLIPNFIVLYLINIFLWGISHLNSCTVGITNCGSHYGNQYGGVPQEIKNRTTIWISIPTLWYASKEKKIIISKTYLCSYVHCTIIYNSLAMETICVHRRINEERKCVYVCVNRKMYICIHIQTMHTQWNIIQP